jgi:hypothetical protein
VYFCQDFVNPFGGKDANVDEFESHMTTGSHHLTLFYADVAASTHATPCTSLGSFAPTPYSSQELDDALSFPAGVAAFLPGTTGISLQSHYLNTTSSAVTAHVEVLLHRTLGAVEHQAAVLFVADKNIDVPAASSATVTDDCSLYADAHILRTSSHMHQHGTRFAASLGGETVYETTSWSDPKPALFDPPIVAPAGTALHFQCSYSNPGPSPLTYGESALTDEMCIFMASFYPAPPGVATVGASGCSTGIQVTPAP